jgi:hypothetical protein
MSTRFHASNPLPPGSKLRLVKADENTPAWKPDIGRFFSVGYYNSQDGLNVIWLVNEKGEYEQTTDQESLGVYFEILRVADSDDFFGLRAAPGTLPR